MLEPEPSHSSVPCYAVAMLNFPLCGILGRLCRDIRSWDAGFVWRASHKGRPGTPSFPFCHLFCFLCHAFLLPSTYSRAFSTPTHVPTSPSASPFPRVTHDTPAWDVAGHSAHSPWSAESLLSYRMGYLPAAPRVGFTGPLPIRAHVSGTKLNTA